MRGDATYESKATTIKASVVRARLTFHAIETEPFTKLIPDDETDGSGILDLPGL